MKENNKNDKMGFPILPQPNKIHVQSEQPYPIKTNNLTPVQFKVPTDIVHKIRCYCYWERITHQQFFDDLVNNFFKEKIVEDIPESVKNRYKAGRNRKF